MNLNEFEFDPTYVNVNVVVNTGCPNCGSKDFEVFKEGDFRDFSIVKVCKDCNNKY